MILSLALISFVFLLVITLVSQVRQDLAYSDARQNHILAKAHARMGMMIAIGEIQKHLGPDMRISTTADIYDERIESLIAQSTDSVDLDGDGSDDKMPSGQRMWTGVWKNRGVGSSKNLNDQRMTNPLPFNGDDAISLTDSWDADLTYDHHPAIEMTWLVSGNEGAKLGLINPSSGKVEEHVEIPDGKPRTNEQSRVLPINAGYEYGMHENAWLDHQELVRTKLTNFYHPLVELPDPDENETVTWILNHPVASDLERNGIKVPKTPIFFSGQKSNNWDDRKGAYAYWVGDEGIKAKIDLNKTFPLVSESILATAPHPHLDEGSFGLQSIESDRGNLISANGLSILGQTEDAQQKLQNFHASQYHDITTHSFGVLADLRTGGLKRDLSLAFGQLAPGQKTSSLIRNDFENNFLFRERIIYKKNLPLFNQASKRNVWLMGADALVQDDNTLLAGPRWSVLADFHNLYRSNPTSLQMEAPDQFPRILGDNNVIFEGRPNSPSNGFDGTRDATLYFNSWDDSQRNHRPEPKNHSLLPVILKVRLAICPVMENKTGGLSVAILPAVTLWNPYDKPLIINDLFLEIPGDSEDRVIQLKSNVVDFMEYDLYRKWWMFLYERDEPLFRENLDEKPDTWLVHEPKLGTKKYPDTYPFSVHLKENNVPRLTHQVYWQDLRSSPLKPYSKISPDARGNWNLGIPPESLYGMKFDHGNGLIYHENSDVSPFYHPRFKFSNITAEGGFTRKVSKIRLSFMDPDYNSPIDTLAPGEVVNFGTFSGGGNFPNVLSESMPSTSGTEVKLVVPICRETAPTFERGFLWKSNFQTPTGLYRIWSMVAGVSSMQTDAVEKLKYQRQSKSFAYAKNPSEKEPKCITLFQGNPDIDFDRTNPAESPRVVTRYSNWTADQVDRTIETSTKYLTDSYQNLGSDPQVGFGWEVGVKLPGNWETENILLNDFNVRTLVHSNQHGKLDWQRTENKKKYLPRNSNYADSFKQNLDNSPTISFKGKVFDFKDSQVPHFFDITPGFPYDEPQGFVNLINALNAFNANPTDALQRATELNFQSVLTDPQHQQDELLDPTMNPDNLGPEIPSLNALKASVGFFSHLEDDNRSQSSNPFSNRFQSSSRAVLFETPIYRPLSLLQYRHACLNNYMHGANYALGNAYASIQVARHRSWARVNHVYEEPTTKWGMGALVANDKMERDAIKWYKEYYQKLWPHPPFAEDRAGDEQASDKKNNFIQWGDIDPTQGYGPWRSQLGSLNHQNIAYDHSFYLNRSLVDGYFLTGSEKWDDFRLQTDTMLGEHLHPCVWDLNSSMPFNHDSHMSAVGNPRFISFLRNGEQSSTSYGLLHKKQNFNTRNDSALRYQTIAGDLLVEGAFNVNSTSVDAWISQLSSLRGVAVANAKVNDNETPIVRFIKEPIQNVGNNWNELRRLSDVEVQILAVEMVRQVKLRGPFLSFSDFVNRRLSPGPAITGKDSRINFSKVALNDWPAEDLNSVTGLRGPIQSAIAASGLNDPSNASSGWVRNRNVLIPTVPFARWSGGKFYDSSFGLIASSLQAKLDPGNEFDRKLGLPIEEKDITVNVADVNDDGKPDAIYDHRIIYPGSKFGDAQENLLAVEGMATGAGKPGWVMQADIIAPLAPSMTARSDTFVIRVMGEYNSKSNARSWIEVVVQRTPDYVKPDLDAPHHRPHEPFMDQNLNGYWDEATDEPWTNLNYNEVGFPDLAGERNSVYRDGMPSDLPIMLDVQEEDIESLKGLSIFGVNQRFGRKFRIVQFRWLRKQDV